jgi:hypothetical protein
MEARNRNPNTRWKILFQSEELWYERGLSRQSKDGIRKWDLERLK